MRTNLILTGILLGLIGGFFIGQFGSDVLLRMLEDRISLVIAVCVATFIFVVIAFLFSDKIIKSLTGARNTQIIEWFDETVGYLVKVIPVPLETREALRGKAQDAFAIYIAWRVRAALFGIVIGISFIVVGSISTHVLLEQNRKLDQQNTLLSRQNDAVRMQILLADAERLGGNRAQAERHVVRIAEAVREKRQKDKDNENLDRSSEAYFAFLNEDLWDETRHILTLLEPYPVFDSQSLIDHSTDIRALDVSYLSRERGTVLKALLDERVNLDHERALNFDFADMRDYHLNGPYGIDGFKVDGCDVRRSSLSNFSLQNANFARARINAVSMPSFSNVNVSLTAFYASSVKLPFASRLPMEEDRPGSVILYDSQIHLSLPEEISDNPLSLDNIHILVEGENADGTNCTEFSFVYGSDGPIIPRISFGGSSLSSIAVEGISSAKRVDVLHRLVALLGDQNEKTVVFSEVAQSITELLSNGTEKERFEFERSIVDSNLGTAVKLQRTGLTRKQVSDLDGVKPEEVLAVVMQFQ